MDIDETLDTTAPMAEQTEPTEPTESIEPPEVTEPAEPLKTMHFIERRGETITGVLKTNAAPPEADGYLYEEVDEAVYQEALTALTAPPEAETAPETTPETEMEPV